MRARLAIGALVAALLLPAVPAAADSLRLETATSRGVTGRRVVYVGDGSDSEVEIRLARSEDTVEPEPVNPQRSLASS